MVNDLYFDLTYASIENLPNKQLLIIIDKQSNEEKYIELLKNIIKALKIDFESNVSLIYGSDQKLILRNIPESYKHIISFGLSFDQLNINIDAKENMVFKFENFKLLYAASLSQLEKDQNKKAQLWKTLQIMFDLIQK